MGQCRFGGWFWLAVVVMVLVDGGGYDEKSDRSLLLKPCAFWAEEEG
jgi:hypothetical protein